MHMNVQFVTTGMMFTGILLQGIPLNSVNLARHPHFIQKEFDVIILFREEHGYNLLRHLGVEMGMLTRLLMNVHQPAQWENMVWQYIIQEVF